MRLWVHTDLDGVMCAVLISEIEEVLEIRFVDPGTVQSGKIRFNKDDILADLPYDRHVGMWFDHHESSKPKEGLKFEGAWKMAPSAARVIFEWAENPYLDKYAKALEEVDKIDSGQVTLEDVKEPKGWHLLSNTLETSAEKREDDNYRIHVIELIQDNDGNVEEILKDEWVMQRIGIVKGEYALFEKILLECTVMIGKVAYSDMRLRPDLPRGNNYLVYSLFPDAVTSVRLMPEKEDKGTVKLSVGHNLFGKMSILPRQNASDIAPRAMLKSDFDVGAAMKKLGGGGHRSVGGATLSAIDSEKVAKKIIDDINAFEAGK